MGKYDAVVIGAGMGGLTAATRLARAGKKVLLCERHNLPGGFATSFKRGRFEFEASLHELCSYGKNPGEGKTRVILEELGVADKLEMCDVPAAFRVISMDASEGIDATMPFGVEAFIDKMEEYAPGSRPSVEKFFELGDEINRTMDFMAQIDGNYNADAVKKILGKYMNFVRTAGYSVDEVFDALHMPKKARDILGAYWSYLGSSLDELGFVHYISMVTSYLKLGAVVPAERSHGMSSAMLAVFEENGGEVWFNSHVEKIIMYMGKVKGVMLADATRVYADHVICNCAPHKVFSTMLDAADIPRAEVKKANARKFAPRGFGVFLGLNRSPEELGINDHCYLIYNTADSKKQFELMKRIETNEVQATVCLNHAIPGCSPEGTSILYFTSLFTDDCWAAVKPEDYVRTKQKIAAKLIENFEKYTGVAIREHIEEIEIATPMTYARYTDAPQGVIYGYLTQHWDGVVQRTMMEATDEKIPGLRFAGGYATMGDGYSSAISSGNSAALKTLADMKD